MAVRCECMCKEHRYSRSCAYTYTYVCVLPRENDYCGTHARCAAR